VHYAGRVSRIVLGIKKYNIRFRVLSMFSLNMAKPTVYAVLGRCAAKSYKILAAKLSLSLSAAFACYRFLAGRSPP
jgi:hypothetical protein